MLLLHRLLHLITSRNHSHRLLSLRNPRPHGRDKHHHSQALQKPIQPKDHGRKLEKRQERERKNGKQKKPNKREGKTQLSDWRSSGRRRLENDKSEKRSETKRPKKLRQRLMPRRG
jgi:hypothetical protein